MKPMHKFRLNTRTKAMILIAAFNVILWLSVLNTGGFIIQRDFNFPTNTGAFISQYSGIWSDVLSKTNIEQIPRLLIMSPLLILAYLGMSVPVLLKLFILMTYLFLSLSMYLFLEALLARLDVEKPPIYSVPGAMIFAYNPVALQFSGEISLLFSLGALPLLLYLSLTSKDTVRFAVSGALLLLLSLGHPFILVMNVTVWFIFTLILSEMNKKSIKETLIKFTMSLVIFALSASWFILPYMSNPLTSTALGREENLLRSVFDVVSDNAPYKIIGLERDKFIYVNTFPKYYPSAIFHYLSLVALILVAFSSFFIRPKKGAKKLILFFSVGYLVSALLSLGSRTLAGELYWYFVKNNALGWIFRSPLKFQLYQSFFISALFIVGLALLLNRRNKYAQYLGFAGTAIIFAGASFYGIADANTSSMNPIELPQEFFEINGILHNVSGPHKVMWYPGYEEKPTDWSRGHIIAPFDAKSSEKPTFDTYRGYSYVKQMLYDVPYSGGLFASDSFYRFLSSLDIEYIAFHNDRNQTIDNENLKSLLDHTDLLYSKNNWYLMKLKEAPSGLFSAKPSIVSVDNNQDIYRTAYPGVAVINSSRISGKDYWAEDIVLSISSSNISISAPAANLIRNPSFEEWNGQMPDGWAQVGGKINISQSEEAYSGNYGLQIETSINNSNVWNFIYSEPVDVKSGISYIVLTHLKYQNVNGTHIKIEGYNRSSGKWNLLAFMPRGRSGDSSDWETYSKIIEAPQGITKARVAIGIGKMLDSQTGTGLVNVDDMALYSAEDILKANRSAIDIEYRKTGPGTYTVKANASSPFMLAFVESYDPLWHARIDKIDGTPVKSEIMRPVPLYSAINGFWISPIGDLDITIEYRPQKWFYAGAIISAITIAACVAYLIYERKKSERSKIAPAWRGWEGR